MGPARAAANRDWSLRASTVYACADSRPASAGQAPLEEQRIHDERQDHEGTDRQEPGSPAPREREGEDSRSERDEGASRERDGEGDRQDDRHGRQQQAQPPRPGDHDRRQAGRDRRRPGTGRSSSGSPNGPTTRAVASDRSTRFATQRRRGDTAMARMAAISAPRMPAATNGAGVRPRSTYAAASATPASVASWMNR